jgi:Ni,Fe-hydrogenase III component G
MTTESALLQAQSVLQPITREFTRPAPERLDAAVAARDLPRAVEALRQARFGYLSAITGLDVPPMPARGEAPAAPGQIEALYHFCEGAAVVTLRVMVPHDAARIPSICHVIPSATLFERELGEMFGVTVEGTPDPDHLLLPDEWPAGVYPLRKSFVGKTEAAGA